MFLENEEIGIDDFVIQPATAIGNNVDEFGIDGSIVDEDIVRRGK